MFVPETPIIEYLGFHGQWDTHVGIASLTMFLSLLLQTRRTASWLVEKMTTEGHAVALLSGELTVEQRAAVIDPVCNDNYVSFSAITDSQDGVLASGEDND